MLENEAEEIVVYSCVSGFSTSYKYKTKTTNSQINKYKFQNKNHIK